jgi:hypothetical protein
MGDLTRTFGGLIIMAHRVNSQTLFTIPFILVYTMTTEMKVHVVTLQVCFKLCFQVCFQVCLLVIEGLYLSLQIYLKY